MGFPGVKIIKACFRDENRKLLEDLMAGIVRKQKQNKHTHAHTHRHKTPTRPAPPPPLSNPMDYESMLIGSFAYCINKIHVSMKHPLTVMVMIWGFTLFQQYLSHWLIVLGFNDMSTFVVILCRLPWREWEKRDRRDSREDEREGQGRKRNLNETEETE